MDYQLMCLGIARAKNSLPEHRDHFGTRQKIPRHFEVTVNLDHVRGSIAAREDQSTLRADGGLIPVRSRHRFSDYRFRHAALPVHFARAARLRLVAEIILQ